MPYAMNEAQFNSVVALAAPKKYMHFIGRVADWRQLWVLKSPEGFVLFGDDAERQCVPVWPHPVYAQALAKDEWDDCVPFELSLDEFLEKWIPGMESDQRLVAVLPTPEHKGIVVEPERLRADLEQELLKYG